MRYGDKVGIDILVHEHLFTASYSIVIHVYHGQAGMALDLERIRARDYDRSAGHVSVALKTLSVLPNRLFEPGESRTAKGFQKRSSSRII